MDETKRREEFRDVCGKHQIAKTLHHGYDRFYPRYIKELGNIPNFGMVEIGMNEINSVKMWLEYFPNAYIYGMDIGMESRGERYSIFRGDQSNLEHLVKFSRYISTFHYEIYLIIDDGTHFPDHQVGTFNYLFANVLKPGGIYIIEIIETSYWKDGSLYGHTFNFGYGNTKSIVEIFKSLVDTINIEFISNEDRETMTSPISADAQKMISSITFGQNCIIVTKKTEDEAKYSDRAYRFACYV